MIKEKTIVITGASQGIGLAIALRLAEEGAQIVILSKDSKENNDVAREQIHAKGGKALIFDVDVTDQSALSRAISSLDRIDVLVNNTSATLFTGTLSTQPEKFDQVMGTSVRAAFFCVQAAFPLLKKAPQPHIINISPPLNLDPKWLKDHLAFSIGKYAMSLVTLGLSAEFEGISVNSLWPKSTIATQTIKDHFSSKVFSGSRWPSIMGEAAYLLLKKDCTGQFFTDEEILRAEGITDFSSYEVDKDAPLMQALFVPDEEKLTRISTDLFTSTLDSN